MYTVRFMSNTKERCYPFVKKIQYHKFFITCTFSDKKYTMIPKTSVIEILYDEDETQ